MRKTLVSSKRPNKKTRTRPQAVVRPNRSQAWEQLEQLWKTTTVLTEGDRLTRSQLHERRCDRSSDRVTVR